jgi:hypothetical protein
MTVNPVEEALGSQTSAAILATDEEVLHWYTRMSVSALRC